MIPHLMNTSVPMVSRGGGGRGSYAPQRARDIDFCSKITSRFTTKKEGIVALNNFDSINFRGHPVTLAGSSLSTYTIARIWGTFSAWIFAHDTRKSLQLSVHTPDPGGIARHFRSIWLVFTRHWSNNKRYTWRSWSPRSIWRYSWRHTRYSQCFQMPKNRRK